MNFDFWTIATIWLACALIALAMTAKKHHRLTLADVLVALLSGPAGLILDALLWSLYSGEKVQLWKREE